MSTSETSDRPTPTGAGLPIREALAAAGQVGRDLLAVDWSRTSLGPPETWPPSLANIVRVVLGSRFSMWMGWGPDLTFFCNEAYRRDTLATKYPWALGRPAREVWAEIWDDLAPRAEAVAAGEATWDESLLLFLERNGYPEETYHTFSYSPLIDESGAISGLFCVVSEETERVIGELRMATLRDLGSEPTGGRTDRDYLEAAARHLGANDRSLPFTAVYLFDAAGEAAELVAASGAAIGDPVAPPRIALDDADPAWPVVAAAAGHTVVVDDLGGRFRAVPAGAWDQPPTRAVVLPLHQQVAGVRPYGFLVAAINRYRPYDEGYRAFLDLLAAQLASGVASARAYETERRRAEELAEIDRAKTAFFTNVSHELRTPLTLLLGPAEDALADRDLPEGQRSRLEMIARNGQRLLKLVNTLLDFSRLQSGRTEAAFEPVDLPQCTAELASMFESAVRRAGLDFVIDCPPLPELVYIDREMWAKVVLNLLSNALKFTFTGGITVQVSEHAGRARLAVSDTGIGIDPAEQSHLFERFHRVQGAIARTHEGSGIGLALVAELAQLHGGTPGVESRPGEGSTFTVDLPFGCAHLPPEAVTEDVSDVSIAHEVEGFLAEVGRWLSADTESERADAPAATRPAATTVADRPRILVVDDNADMREYVASVLVDNYAVRTAPDGQTALELALAQPPDLVLTDVMMPRLDGFGLLHALRSDPETMHVPVVMLSARAGEYGVIEGLEAGADDYLAKPFSARELTARVRANLELDRVRRTRDQLERSQTMLNQAERLSGVGSWEVDLASGKVRNSPQLLEILGIDQKTFGALDLGAVIGGLLHPDDRERVQRTLDAGLRGGEDVEYEARIVRSGETRWISVRGEVVHDERGAPVVLRGFMQDITQRREAERAIAAAAAARRAAEHEHQIADALQRSLLPAEAFRSDHLEVATYYQAGVEGTRVGGDWYDAIDLGAGRTALVVGDVAGRGVRAASVMGQLRAAVRAYAPLDLPPAEILELLNSMVYDLTGGQLVTCVYAIYEPVSRELRYASAGHLPSLLSVPGQPTVRMHGASGPPLGLGWGRFTEHRLTLSPGAVVTFYTDGLVERRGEDLDANIDRLASLITADGGSVARVPDRVVETLAGAGTDDDIAILMARVSHTSVQHTAVFEVPPSAGALSEARRFAMRTLAEWELPDSVTDDAILIVSELVTNAIVHGRPPVRLRLVRAPRELAIEVDDDASAIPRKLHASLDDINGRGLAIVAEIGTRWAARANGRGKTVWSTLPIPGLDGAGNPLAPITVV